MADRVDIKFGMRIAGGRGAEIALDRVLEAASPAAIKSNFRKVVDFAFRKVVDRTPGKTRTLAGGWEHEDTIEERPGSFRFASVIRNKLADVGVTYLSTDGTEKPKLRTFPSEEQQKWGEVIRILDRGGKRHVITPKRKKFLSWWGYTPGRNAETGRYQVEGLFPVFAKKVNHPGHPAFGMLTQTATEMETLAKSLLFDRIAPGIVNAWNLDSGLGR